MTERGRPIARLVPVGKEHSPEGRIALLIREGRMKPPTGPFSLRPVEALPKDPQGRVLEALLEERAEGR